MTIQDLGALGELIGSVAVLATLIYLAFQMRQNTQAISAQLEAARLTSALTVTMTQVTCGELQEALQEDRTDEKPINESRREYYWWMAMIHFHWLFIQGRRGLLPTLGPVAVAEGVRTHSAPYRSFGTWWGRVRQSFVPDFVELVDEQLRRAA